MKGQDGYTAVEALAALAILGLAMGGLTVSMNLIGAGQAKARARFEQAVLERAANQKLEQLLAIDAPFRSDQAAHLVGDAQALQLDCGNGLRCGARLDHDVLILQRGNDQARLQLPEGDTPHFLYFGSYGVSDIWPPAPLPPPAPAWQTLEAIALQSQIAGEDKPLLVAKIWRQQRADCEYDVVIQDCRSAGL